MRKKIAPSIEGSILMISSRKNRKLNKYEKMVRVYWMKEDVDTKLRKQIHRYDRKLRRLGYIDNCNVHYFRTVRKILQEEAA